MEAKNGHRPRHHHSHHHGHHHDHSHPHGHEHAAHSAETSQAHGALKVVAGDVVVSQCKHRHLELIVATAFSPDECGVECEIDVKCCGKPMVKMDA